MERFFDIFFSVLALLVLSPFLLAIVLLLTLSGEGEVLFKQERMGRAGKKFKLYKFATMKKNSPQMGTGTVTIKDDPRILPLGKFLRKTKINELPQLLNVLLGDMSLIGPRPLTPENFDFYPESSKNAINQVRPGLSGLGSIVFRREEEIMQGANASLDFYAQVIAPYKGALEEWFVRRKGLYVYFAAVFVTCWTVLWPKSTLVQRIFKDLPEPGDDLKRALSDEL